MTTKVEQLVMGAFWEAAEKVHTSNRLPRFTLEEVEHLLAYHVARLIREQVPKVYDVQP